MLEYMFWIMLCVSLLSGVYKYLTKKIEVIFYVGR